jgi:hypothetical protein
MTADQERKLDAVINEVQGMRTELAETLVVINGKGKSKGLVERLDDHEEEDKVTHKEYDAVISRGKGIIWVLSVLSVILTLAISIIAIYYAAKPEKVVANTNTHEIPNNHFSHEDSIYFHLIH